MKFKELVKMQQRKARVRKAFGAWIVFVPPNRTLGVAHTPSQAWQKAAQTLARKRRKSARDMVDEMIDFCDQQKKPGRTINVNVTASTVRKFARRRRGHYWYRDHVIVPLKASLSIEATNVQETIQ